MLLPTMLLLLLPLLASPSSSAETVLLPTSSLGRLRGTVSLSRPGSKPFHAFRALPFAKPPVGELRLRPPVAPDDVDAATEVDATKAAPRCAQLLLAEETHEMGEEAAGQEDCLYLDVYTPVTSPKETKNLLPVIVFFHGVSFVSASSPSSLGAEYLMDSTAHPAVVVTANVRLGPLGWLSNEDAALPGNLALQDAAAALAWVRRHAGEFGGDAAAVTAAGHAAGGAVVAALLASPELQGLFARAALLSPWPLLDSPLGRHGDAPSYYASAFVAEVGCDEGVETEEIVQCLQGKPVETLLAASSMFQKFAFAPNPWKPVDDSKFASSPVLPNGGDRAALEAQKMPILLGTSSEMGSMLAKQFIKSSDKLEELDSSFDASGALLLTGADEHVLGEEDSSTAQLVRLHYLGNDTGKISLGDGGAKLTAMLGDACMRAPLHAMAVALAKEGAKGRYYYHMAYPGDELRLVFNVEGKELETEQEKKLSKKLTTLLTRFASSSSASDDDSLTSDSRWRQLGAAEEEEGGEVKYAVIDDSPIRMALDHEFKENYDFLSAVMQLLENSRNFDPMSHPAIVNYLKDREEERGGGGGLHDEF